MQEDNNPNSVTEGSSEGTNPSAGSGNASNVLSLEEMNKHLGRDFKDSELALKAIKDTFDFVGSTGQIKKRLNELKEQGLSEDEVFSRLKNFGQGSKDPSPTVSQEVQERISKLEDENFYVTNPDLKDYASVLSDLRNSSGLSLKELVSSDKYKPVFEKLTAQDKAADQKRVLESNPRLGRVRDKMKEARELVRDNPRAAKDTAVGAVLDAFESK